MKTFKQLMNEISIDLAGRTREARFKEIDNAYGELRSLKRFIPGHKNKMLQKIAKANRGISRADDTEYRRAIGEDKTI